jgi:hypothetical protein
MSKENCIAQAKRPIHHLSRTNFYLIHITLLFLLLGNINAQTDDTDSEKKSSITIAFFIPYGQFDVDRRPDGSYYINSISQMLISADSSAQITVDTINSLSDVLPDVHVNIVRYNSYDLSQVGPLSVSQCGGYSASMAYELIQSEPSMFNLKSFFIFFYGIFSSCGSFW